MFKAFKLMLVFLLLFVGPSFAADKSDIETIMNYVDKIEVFKNKDLELYRYIEDHKGTDIEVSTFWSEENLANHNNFDYHWEAHYLIVKKTLKWNTFRLSIVTKEYQEFVSPDARGFIEWSLNDLNLNGKIDQWEKRFSNRDYQIVKDDLFVYPTYPKGFVNFKWYNPDIEESQAKFDYEIDYWLKIIKAPNLKLKKRGEI